MPLPKYRSSVLLCFLLSAGSLVNALQTPAAQPTKESQTPDLVRRQPSVDRSDRLRFEYRLGADDIITVEVAEDDTFKGKPIRINSSGEISVPLVGREEAAGKTVAELEDQIAADLSRYLINPQVSVSVVEYRSQPVSVLGAVNKPGVYQMEGPRTLAQMIAVAGGVTADAGFELTLTRETRWGDIPLKGALTDPDQKYNTAKVDLSEITSGAHPENDIQVRPFDEIFVPKGQMIYVMGEVAKSGAFILHDQDSLSVLEAVSMAGGYNPRAAPGKARILRSAEGQDHRQELPVNLKAVALGQAPDVRLLPKDVLVVPNDSAREFRTRIIEAAIALGTGILIFR